MTVVNPKSISGINSITTGSGSDDILTIHTNNGTERLRIDSTGTTKIVTGIVTTLTATTGIVTTLTANTVTSLGAVSGTTGTFSSDVSVAGDFQVPDVIKHEGDVNTKIRFPAADTVSVETDGSERLRIQSNGYVNIGIGTAEEQLTIRNTTQQCLIRLISNSSNTAGIDFGDAEDTDIGRIRYYHSDGSNTNYMNFHVNAEERLRITSGGQVLIGNTADPSDYNGGADDLIIGSHSGNSGMTILSGTSNGGFIMFSDNNGGGTNAYRGQIEYAHSTDSMRFITSSGERIRFLSGGGITFNGDTATANALNDYEEGYWSPTAVDGMTLHLQDSGNVPCRRYVKIGKQVTCWFDINFDSGNNAVNFRTRFSGLPFSVETGGHQAAAAVVFGYFNGDNSEGEGLMAHISSGLVEFFEDGNELWSYSESAGDRIAGYLIYTTN